MIITIFYFLLLLVQIIMLIKTIRNFNKINYSLLLSTIITSIATVILFVIYSGINNKISNSLLSYILIIIINSSLYIIMLIAGLIVKIIKSKKNKLKNIKNIKRSLIINIIVIFITFLIAIFMQNMAYEIKDKNLQKKAEKQVITLLNKKYGNGNFKIVKILEKSIFLDKLNNNDIVYEFIVSTNYLDENFVISLHKNNLKIYEDDFLNKYYGESLKITNLENYLKNYKVNKLNKSISENFNAEINFNNIYVSNYLNKNYGMIPTIDKLSNYVELYEPKIKINENIKTKEELLNYLLKLSKFFIVEFDNTNIFYLQTNKYFRYEYDFTKLDEYTYQSNNEGYVLAGNYNYLKNQPMLENEDTIIRINIMGDVKTFNKEEILKE